MIFSDGKNNIGGYDPRFILLASAVDYAFFFLDGMFLTMHIARWVSDSLPEWLSVLLVITLFMACAFLALLGPMVFIYLVAKGWQALANK